MPAGERPVVLDVMGGDAAPHAALEAADRLAAEGIDVLLCGPAEIVRGTGAGALVAETAVAMDQTPAFAVRSAPDASVRVAARAVAKGVGGAMVSAGSTGATVAAAVLEIGRRPGVRRAVLAARIPTPSRTVLLVDVGARTRVDPATLLATAQLGIAHARAMGTDAPTVGLLNIGVEDEKGPPRLQDAARLLADLEGFCGNVEPSGLLAGVADVVVTDGFTGNIVLKTIEALGGAAGRSGSVDSAALLLGVRGTVLVAHGAATAIQLADAVRMAGSMACDTPTTAPRPTGALRSGQVQGTAT